LKAPAREGRTALSSMMLPKVFREPQTTLVFTVYRDAQLGALGLMPHWLLQQVHTFPEQGRLGGGISQRGWEAASTSDLLRDYGRQDATNGVGGSPLGIPAWRKADSGKRQTEGATLGSGGCREGRWNKEG